MYDLNKKWSALSAAEQAGWLNPGVLQGFYRYLRQVRARVRQMNRRARLGWLQEQRYYVKEVMRLRRAPRRASVSLPNRVMAIPALYFLNREFRSSFRRVQAAWRYLVKEDYLGLHSCLMKGRHLDFGWRVQDRDVERLQKRLLRRTIRGDYVHCLIVADLDRQRCSKKWSNFCNAIKIPLASKGCNWLCQGACNRQYRLDKSRCQRIKRCLNKGRGRKKTPKACGAYSAGNWYSSLRWRTLGFWPAFDPSKDWYRDWGDKYQEIFRKHYWKILRRVFHQYGRGAHIKTP